MENTLNSQKTENIIIVYRKYLMYCSDVYNLSKELDNSFQIVKITGHA